MRINIDTAACRALIRMVLERKFGGSSAEAIEWMETPNDFLEGATPIAWIAAGRLPELIDLIRSEVDVN